MEESRSFAGERDKYLKPQEITALVMKNPRAKNMTLANDKNEVVDESTQDAVLNLMFPPKAWMSDYFYNNLGGTMEAKLFVL